MQLLSLRFLVVFCILGALHGAAGQSPIDGDITGGGNQRTGGSSRRLSGQAFQNLLSDLAGKKPSRMPERGMHSSLQRQSRERRHHDAPAMGREETTRDADLSGMRYWKKGLAKASPTPLPPTDRFISFEPWRGGFNNVRMSLELAMALALATNRTLVMPATEYKINMLKDEFDWSDYYDLEDMARGVPIIYQKEFMAKVGLPDSSGRVQFPEAHRRFNVKNFVARGWRGIWERSQMYGVGEDVLKKDLAVGQIYCVPDCPKKSEPYYDEFQVFRKGRMPYVSTSSWDVAPDDKPNYKNIVHFSQNGLGAFYTAVFIRPKALDVQNKEAMKNHLHLNENIFGPAERVLKNLLESAPSFSCLHIRRGDFQFKETLTPVNKIMENIEELIPRGVKHMWIMTQEKHPHEFFSEMKTTYELHFLDDYMSLLQDVKPSLYSMIESVICSRARVFSGTFKSSLTGLVHRLRGSMDDVEDKNVYFNQVKYPEGYGKDWGVRDRNQVPNVDPRQGIEPGKGVPSWAREFREAWDTEWNHDAA